MSKSKSSASLGNVIPPFILTASAVFFDIGLIKVAEFVLNIFKLATVTYICILITLYIMLYTTQHFHPHLLSLCFFLFSIPKQTPENNSSGKLFKTMKEKTIEVYEYRHYQLQHLLYPPESQKRLGPRVNRWTNNANWSAIVICKQL